MVVITDAFEVSKTPAASKRLQTEAKKVVNDAARGSAKLREFALKIRDGAEEALGDGWHVIVGHDFAVDLRYRKGACVLLLNKKTRMKVLVYRTTAALAPTPTAGDKDENQEAVKPQQASKVVVIESDMNAAMQEQLMNKLQQFVAQYRTADDADTAIAQATKRSLGALYRGTWHVVVSRGREVTCVAPHDPETLLHVVVGKFHVILYCHAGVDVDTRMDMALLGNRLSLIGAAICAVLYTYLNYSYGNGNPACLNEAINGTDFAVDLPEGCSHDDLQQIIKFKRFKTIFMLGIVICTVVASLLRMYRSTLRQKTRQL